MVGLKCGWRSCISREKRRKVCERCCPLRCFAGKLGGRPATIQRTKKDDELTHSRQGRRFQSVNRTPIIPYSRSEDLRGSAALSTVEWVENEESPERKARCKALFPPVQKAPYCALHKESNFSVINLCTIPWDLLGLVKDAVEVQVAFFMQCAVIVKGTGSANHLLASEGVSGEVEVLHDFEGAQLVCRVLGSYDVCGCTRKFAWRTDIRQHDSS